MSSFNNDLARFTGRASADSLRKSKFTVIPHFHFQSDLYVAAMAMKPSSARGQALVSSCLGPLRPPLMGQSPIEAARKALALALAREEHARRFYKV